MNTPLTTVLAVDIPPQFLQNIAYGMMAIIAIATVFSVIKCIQGADMLEHGEDGKKKIYSGIAIGIAPWLALASFKTTHLDDKLKFSEALSSLPRLDGATADVLELALWAVIGISAVWCVAKCVSGANALEHGEEGKKKIVSGLAIGAAPWLAIAALRLGGFWDALGMKLG